MPNNFFRSSSSGIMVSNSGTIGTSVAAASRTMASRYGRGAHGAHHLLTVAQIGKRLDVGAAYERLIGGRAAT